MLSITAQIVIARPPAAVFAFAGDCRNDPAWRGAVSSAVCSELPRLGAQVVETIRFGGLRAESLTEIIAFEPGRRLAFRTLSGPVPCEVRRLFEPVEAGTRLRHELRLMLPAGWRWTAPLFVPLLRLQLAIDLRRLRRLLEAPAALPPARGRIAA